MIALAMGIFVARAATQAPLTASGQRLEAQYAEQMKSLMEGISRALPSLSERNKGAYLKAREAVPFVPFGSDTNAAQLSGFSDPDFADPDGS